MTVIDNFFFERKLLNDHAHINFELREFSTTGIEDQFIIIGMNSGQYAHTFLMCINK